MAKILTKGTVVGSFEDSASLVSVDSTNFNVLEGTNAQSVFASADEKIGNLRTKLLWENASPSTAIASGATITLASDDYDYLDIIYVRTTSTTSVQSVRARKGDPILLMGFSLSASSFAIFQRGLTCTDDTTITSGTPYKFSASLSSFARSTETSACIPVAIYGGKFE